MIFGQDRDELRQMYTDAWRKFKNSSLLSPLDTQIAAVVELHPEYHQIIVGENVGTDYTGDGGQTNPYLHMGLHLSLREQIATDRPEGIRTIFQSLAASMSDVHDAEHQMIECLAKTLWEAQSRNCAPDEQQYMVCLRRQLR